MSILSVGQLRGLTVNNNVITVPSGHTLTQSGAILQVQQTVLSARQTYGSVTSFTNISGLAVTITPKFSTSKILVSSSVIASVSGSTTICFKIQRNGTDIGIGDSGRSGRTGWRIENSSTAWADTGTYQFLDSPASTSPLTYQVQVLPYADGRSVAINNSWNGGSTDDFTGISTITVMEVAQ